MAGVLADLRVLDLGHYLAGPMLAMFLADHGADVLHVDPPGGPRWRSPANVALYRGKRVVELDLRTPEGSARLRDLAAGADVVIENFRPGVVARLGLDRDELLAANPHVVWCSMPGFPHDDDRAPIPAWEGVVAAATGLYAARHGDVAGEPVFSALPMASTFAAFMASHRVVGALLDRARSGHGAAIEVSLYEAAFQAVGSYAEVPVSRKTDNPVQARMHRTLEVAECADGTHLYLDTPLRGLQALLDRFLPGHDLLRLDDESASVLADELRGLFASRTGLEWERICQEELHGSFGLCQSTAAWLDDEHALESETVIPVDDAELGPTHQPGWAVRMSDAEQRARWGRGAAPTGQTGWEGAGFDLRVEAASDGGPPLAGVRVLDCASLLAGPTTTRVLAQYGAEVVKVDRAGLATGQVDPLADDLSAFHGHRTVSAGKRMAFLDLKDAAVQDLLPGLLRSVDVVHHNFTPDAARRLGLAADRVHDLNPAAICSTMSLHSHGGRREHYRGHEPLAQMVSGMGVRAGDGTPRMLGVVVNDHAAGHLNAFGIMLALLDRMRTGRGQAVNASLSRTATLHQLPFAVGHAGRTWTEPSGSAAVGWHALDRLYRVQDGWVYVGAASEADRSRLAELDGVEWLAGVGAVSDDELGTWLEDRLADQDAATVTTALSAAGLGAHRHVPIADLVDDQYARDHGLLVVLDHPGLGRGLGIGHPVFETREESGPRFLPARRPGRDTIDVLTQLGAADRITELLERGAAAVGENPVVNTSTVPGYWTSGRVVAYAPPDRLASTLGYVANAETATAYPCARSDAPLSGAEKGAV